MSLRNRELVSLVVVGVVVGFGFASVYIARQEVVNSASLQAFAGQTVRLVVEAADASTASLVEAGVDDLRITSSP